MPLWDPDADVPPIRNSKETKVNHGTLNPEGEFARMAALKRLRHKMKTLCSKASSSSKPPVLAFERWLARAALRRTEELDWIIPSDGHVCEGLAKDLSRALSKADAYSIAEQMALESKKAAERIATIGLQRSSGADERRGLEQARKDIKNGAKAVNDAAKITKQLLKEKAATLDREKQNNDKEGNANVSSALESLRKATSALEASIKKAQRACGEGTAEVNIDNSRRPGIFDVALVEVDGTMKRPYLTVSESHLRKLVQLWNLRREEETGNAMNGTKPGASEESPEVLSALLPEDKKSFLQTLYCCLSRYEALKGAGYQCAVPGMAFDAAAKCGLGTTIECFASPLNCRYRRYCSAFPDIESRFSSIGSFFDDFAFDPVEGSFEANPPFVPETMTTMGQKIERLLGDKDRGALSFLVVVPAWGAGIQFCRNLEKSRHVRAATRVPAAEHAFCDGAQHTKRSTTDPELRPSSWDTACILLQNEAGATRWPVNTAKLEASFGKALREASSDIPEKLATLEAWEHRGAANGGSEKKRMSWREEERNNKKHKKHWN